MVYLLGWLLNYYAFLLWKIRLRYRLIFLIPISFIGTVIFIRYSGTDTYPIYEVAFRALIDNETDTIIEGWEPGFVLLAKVLLALTGSEIWAVRGIGVFFILCLMIFVVRADKTELKYLALYFVPIFVYQYGMNAIRSGLALTVLLLGWQALRRRKWVSFILLSLMAFTFHYSVALIIALLVITEIELRNKRAIYGVGIFVLLIGFAIGFRYGYFEAKLDLYRAYESPSSISGVSRSGLIALLGAFFLFSPLPVKRKMWIFGWLMVLTLFFQVLSFYSYAGLRFVDLILFISPLALIREFDRNGREPARVFWVGLGVVGLFGAATVYRNFLSDFDGQMTGTLTPFLPYRTVFDYEPSE